MLLAFAAPQSSLAQQFGEFHSITQKEGLPNDFVQCIFQDSKGFIWIGTENGLARYDGNRFSVFKENPLEKNGFYGTWVSNIYEDSRGNLWVGTNKGLNFMNPKTSEFELIDLAINSGTKATVFISSIIEDPQQNLWLSTNSNGLKCLSTEANGEWNVEHFFHEPGNKNTLANNRIDDMAIDKEGILWITNKFAIQRMNTVTKKIETFVSDIPNPQSYYQNNIPTIRFDQNGKIIFITPFNGIYRIEDAINSSYSRFLYDPEKSNSLAEKRINDILPITDDRMWVGTNEGLYEVNLQTNEMASFRHDPMVNGSLSSDRINSLMLDDHHNLWMATLGGGLNVFPNKEQPFKNYSHQPNILTSLTNNQVRSMLRDDAGFLWVATLGGGVDKMQYDDKKGWIKIANRQKDVSDRKALQSNDIILMMKARTGKIWIATSGKSLVEMDPTTGQMDSYWKQPGDPFDYEGIWSLCEDRKGNIWIGTRDRGVFLLDPQTKKFIDYSNNTALINKLSNMFVFDIFEDHLGNLWFCTEAGLINYNPDADELQTYLTDPNDPKSISDDWVWTITEDSQNNLWVGTNLGLNHFNRDSASFHRYYEQDGLPSNVVWGILEDDEGHIWVSTDIGLAVGRAQNKSFRTYNRQSTLHGDNFLPHANYKDESTGQLFFGGLHGFNIIHPEIIQPDTVQPRMVLSTFSVKNQSKQTEPNLVDHLIANREMIQLNYLDDILTFTFSDLNYQGEDNYFEYQLLGLSDQWIPLGDDKTMTFIDLEPGNYSLLMKGVMPNGILIDEKKLLEINVQPPWWKTWWAYAIYGIALISLFWLAYRFQLKRQMEKQEGQRLIELDQVKSRLYTNITHEFRTPLTVIKGIAGQIKKETLDSDKALIERNSDQLLNLVNQMLDLRKLESGAINIQKKQGDFIKLIRYLTESLKSYAEAKGLTVHFLSDKKDLLMDFDAEKITRIHSNLLSNAIKFTKEGGDIYVQVLLGKNEEREKVMLKIKDTGVGISEEKLPHIFERFYQVDDSATRQGEGTGIGLTLVAELIKAMNGNIEVDSNVGEGTTFTITFPITNIAEMETNASFETISNTTMIVEAAPSSIVTEALENNNSSIEKPTVLIVEDNADVIHYLITCLKEHYTIEIAMNGQEGIEKAIEEIPDIIISDVMMPVKDGFELCQTLKTDERTSHIPIILLTAKADIESRLEGLQRGADAYLSKPFLQEELLVILQSQLELRKKLQSRFASFSDQPLPIEPLAILEGESIEIELEVEDAFLQKIRAIIEKDLSDNDIGMPQLMRGLGMSRSQIYKKVKALTGASPSRYVRSIRLNHAQKLLKTSDLNVSEVAYEVGFSSPVYFSDVFLEEFGIRPYETRK